MDGTDAAMIGPRISLQGPRSPRVVTVRVPGRPPGGNALHRQGFWRVRKDREEWRAVAAMAARLAMGAGFGPPIARAEVAVEWRCRTRRRRDFDNLVAGLKPLLDGLVDAGVIQDDDSEHLAVLGPLTILTGVREDETVLTVREGTWPT